MSTFVQIPADLLASIATDEERIPSLYYSANPLVRRVFWMRLRALFRLALRHASARGICLDFGGGGGVFLPSLAGAFERVVSLDRIARESRQVVEHYGLRNTELIEADALEVELEQAPFDVIVAADVLEHFRELGPPVAALGRWLAHEGVLLTSLPTESGLYAGLRSVFGVVKPEDHYHTAYEVESFLQRHGFERIERRGIPIGLPLLPLFLVSAWRRRPVP